MSDKEIDLTPKEEKEMAAIAYSQPLPGDTPLQKAKKELESMQQYIKDKKKGWRLFRCKACGTVYRLKYATEIVSCGGCAKLKSKRR